MREDMTTREPALPSPRLLGAAFGAVVLAMTLLCGSLGVEPVGATNDGVDYAMRVGGSPGGAGAGCNTSGGESECTVPVGSVLTIATDLNSAGTITGSVAGSEAHWTAAGPLSIVDRTCPDGPDPGTDPDLCASEVTGPPDDCGFQLENTVNLPTGYAAACVDSNPPSAYGASPTELYQIDLICDDAGQGTVTLVHGVNETNILDLDANPHADKGSDVLTITCVDDDKDDDGCSDAEELGPDERFGGRRDPNNFWDFFDTPNVANTRDQVVNVIDISWLVLRFGKTGSPAIDPLSPPPASGYHSAFDRTAAVPPAERWDLGPADGSINVVDIASMVAQFGHTCAG